MIGYAEIDLERLREYGKDHQEWFGYDNGKRKYALSHSYTDKSVEDAVKEGGMEKLRKLKDYLDMIGQRLELYIWDEDMSVIGYNKFLFIVPSCLVSAEMLKDYGDQDVLALESSLKGLSGSGLMPISSSGSLSSAERERDALKKEQDALEAKRQQIEDGTADELSDIKKQIDALMARMDEKKQSLLKQLEAMQAEYAKKAEEMKKKIWMLETRIYGIRCYMGETASFYTVRSGHPAEASLPVVVYQKIRYLDEELGRHLSLFGYGAHWNDKQQFLDVLKERDDIADLLCPGPKSINAVKISRTGTVKGCHHVFANMLEDYALYHENQLAILIRNGEQIHIAWLDADKISLSDEDLFLAPSKGTEDEAPGVKNDYERRNFEEEERRKRLEILSRRFFFIILQGVLDNTNGRKLISIPEKASITDMGSPYIKFSTAEGWIADTRYGTFAEMLEKSAGIPLREGDMILTGTYITKSHGFGSNPGATYNNERGIGYRNRTRGIGLWEKTIYPVNKVIPGIKVRYTGETVRCFIEKDPEGRAWYKGLDQNDTFRTTNKRPGMVFDCFETTYKVTDTDEVTDTFDMEREVTGSQWYDGPTGRTSPRHLTFIALSGFSGINCRPFYNDNPPGDNKHKEYIHEDSCILEKLYDNKTPIFRTRIKTAEIIGKAGTQYFEYYVSEKWRSTDPSGVNFQFFKDEVIPLPFMCSTWVRSVIQNKSVGDYTLCGSSMNYTDLLPYLKLMLEHLEEREKEEKKMLMDAPGGKEWIERHAADWDAVLCEWKIKNRIHRLTETRAKRFIRENA